MSAPPEASISAEWAPASPCIGVCLLDPASRRCRGCLRSTAEIARWCRANAAEKRQMLAELAERRRRLQ